MFADDGPEDERVPLHFSDGVTIVSAVPPVAALVATKTDLLALDVDPAEAAVIASKVKGFSQRRQFTACCSVQALSVMGGVCIAHSSSLIPALTADDSDIPITMQQGAWIGTAGLLRAAGNAAMLEWLMRRWVLLRGVSVESVTLSSRSR